MRILWTLSVLTTVCVGGCTSTSDKGIGSDEAIEAALGEVGDEVLGFRFDAPDNQWDVFVRSGEQAYEVEVDARTGAIVAIEEEDLEEVRAELSGDLSHEGVDGDTD